MVTRPQVQANVSMWPLDVWFERMWPCGHSTSGSSDRVYVTAWHQVQANVFTWCMDLNTIDTISENFSTLLSTKPPFYCFTEAASVCCSYGLFSMLCYNQLVSLSVIVNGSDNHLLSFHFNSLAITYSVLNFITYLIQI